MLPPEKQKKQSEKLFWPVLYSVKKSGSTGNRYKVGNVNLRCEDILRKPVPSEERSRMPGACRSSDIKPLLGKHQEVSQLYVMEVSENLKVYTDP